MIKREELTNPNSCMSRARDEEMTFVLLGRDAAAPVAIRAWVDERIRLGKNKRGDPQIVEALTCADTIERTQVADADPLHAHTWDWEEHPDGYDDACYCQSCREYCAE